MADLSAVKVHIAKALDDLEWAVADEEHTPQPRVFQALEELRSATRELGELELAARVDARIRPEREIQARPTPGVARPPPEEQTK